MRYLLTLIVLLGLVAPVKALDSAADTRRRTDDAQKQAAIDEVPRLLSEVDREINTSAANGLYFAIVRVNRYSENAVTIVSNQLKQKGYAVNRSRSGKNKEFRSLVISWEK